MVYYFTTRCGQYTIYMGRDKYENEDLIRYGHPEDAWFHVDDLSSAHVYLRMKPGMTLDDIPPDCLVDCCTLVKANSIVGCKRSSVYVVYTRWQNLRKTSDMVDGQVGYHRPNNVRRVNVDKNSVIVRQLEKTRREVTNPDLAKEQGDRLDEIRNSEKTKRRNEEKERRLLELDKAREREERSYDRIMRESAMTSNTGKWWRRPPPAPRLYYILRSRFSPHSSFFWHATKIAYIRRLSPPAHPSVCFVTNRIACHGGRDCRGRVRGRFHVVIHTRGGGFGMINMYTNLPRGPMKLFVYLVVFIVFQLSSRRWTALRLILPG